MKKIGIYAGTFDPIHEGHIAFAEKALSKCGLDKIFFLVEPRPRRKQGVRALEHRQAMLRLAIADTDIFGAIQLEQANFSVEDTLPKLQALFAGAELYMLMGEDVFVRLNSWPHVEDLFQVCNFIVGIRKGGEDEMEQLIRSIKQARGIAFNVNFLVTKHHEISSSKIRSDLKKGSEPIGLIPSTTDYINQNGLYKSS